MFSITKNIKIKKIYCFISGKYRKYRNLKTCYIFDKKLVLYIICSKCDNEDEKLFKEEESIKILKVLGLIKNIKFLKIWLKKS